MARCTLLTTCRQRTVNQTSRPTLIAPQARMIQAATDISGRGGGVKAGAGCSGRLGKASVSYRTTNLVGYGFAEAVAGISHQATPVGSASEGGSSSFTSSTSQSA